MATELAERLDEQKIMAKTLTLELKTTKFEKKQRSFSSSYFMCE